MTTFADYRKFAARKLEASENAHIRACAELLGDIEWEGPEMFSVSISPPHAQYEDWVESGCDLSDFWEEEGRHMMSDWIIDMHPGLCPADVVKAVKCWRGARSTDGDWAG